MPPCEVRSTARKVNSTIYGKSSAKFIVEKGHVHTRLSNKLHAPRGENKCGTSDSGYVHRTVTHFWATHWPKYIYICTGTAAQRGSTWSKVGLNFLYDGSRVNAHLVYCSSANRSVLNYLFIAFSSNPRAFLDWYFSVLHNPIYWSRGGTCLNKSIGTSWAKHWQLRGKYINI